MITPTQSDVLTALRSFLIDRLPAGVDAIQGIENRVAEPSDPNFVVMTLIRAVRLATNYDVDVDVKFTGAIAPGAAAFTASIDPTPAEPGVMPTGLMTVTAVGSGTIVNGSLVTGGGVLDETYVVGQVDGAAGGIGTYTVSRAQVVLSGALALSYGLMTVSAVARGTILADANVYGVAVATPTKVRALGSGTGGVGTYIVGPTQSIASRTLSAGGRTIRQNANFTVQLDFHSLDSTSAVDMAQTIATAFRDPYAVSFFSDLTAGTISPLFADDPRFVPFQQENQQYEHRWIVEANLQVNQTIRVPAQYADLAEVVLISVDTGPPYP